MGRLESVENIANFTLGVVGCKKQNNGKKVVITTGATIEKIDDVRYISNHSSGLQGVLIANEFCKNGYEAVLICGKIDDNVREKILPQIRTINCFSAKQMLNESLKQMPCNVFASVAAVCDFYVTNAQNGKIKKNEGGLKTISLAENEDILKTISTMPKEHGASFVVGFAAEGRENLEKYALEKIKTKGCEIIVANSIDGGFGGENQALVKIFDKNGKVLFNAANTTKLEVAKQIVDIVNEKCTN
jgi:phosphopantothenoylcysteine decarboxylase / phosphopantothenate---cysteine ligase